MFGLIFLYISYQIYRYAFFNKKIQENKIFEISDLNELSFWLDFFNKLPYPIFIKQLKRGNEQHEHIMMNKAMIEFESNEFEDKRFKGIIDKRLEDYMYGDNITYEHGKFKQLEMCMNMEKGIKPSIILTLKELLVYNNNSYIIGTYIPVEPSGIKDKNTYKIKMKNGQLIFSIKEAHKSDSGIDINIGEAVKESLNEIYD